MPPKGIPSEEEHLALQVVCAMENVTHYEWIPSGDGSTPDLHMVLDDSRFVTVLWQAGAVDDPVYHGIGDGLHPAEHLLVFGTGWCVVVGVFCVEVVLDEYIPGPGPVHIVQVFAPRP